MRYLSAITMLILTLAIMQPVAAQSFKPDIDVGAKAYAEKDYATALKHFLPLTKKGHAEAQSVLGNMYRKGQVGIVNYDLALFWYREAAKQGDPYSLYNLGVMYRDGQGVVQDLVMAYVSHNVAVAKGNNFYSWVRKRDEVHAKLTAPERRLALKLSKLCYKKPAKCPEYRDD